MKKNIKNISIISASFLIIIWPILLRMYQNQQATFGGWDSVTQMYPVLTYVKKFWENIFQSILLGELEIPMMEWTLGMGEDLIITLNWHGFGDPFYFFAIFVSESYLPQFYSFLFYFRVLLGGIGFYFLVRNISPGKSDLAYIVGALSYCFTGFMVQSNFHIIFVHMMVYLPLMLLGALRVLDGKRKGLLGVSAFLFALSGFYFLYIASVGLGIFVIYQLVRRKIKLQDSVILILQMVAEYLVGLCLGAVYLVPSFVGFLGSNRASTVKEIPLLLSMEQLKKMAVNIFLPSYDDFPVLAVSTICFICVMLLFMDWKRHRERIIICVFLLLACVPVVSCIMSGFGEIYDRWEILITIYAAYLVVLIWDELIHINLVQKGILALSGLGIYGMARLFDVEDHQRFGVTVKCYILISVVLLLLGPICKRIKREKCFYYILFVIAVITLMYNWKEAARTREYSYVQERNIVKEFEIGREEEFYRIDNSRTAMELKIGLNHGLLMNYPSVSEFFSIENPYYTKALLSWNANAQATGNHMNTGMDSRSVLETLASVKYYIWNNTQPTKIPYGYIKKKMTNDGEWVMYENPYALPILYGYDTVYNKDSSQKLNGFELQNIMIQSAMVEEYDGTLKEAEYLQNDLYENPIQLISIEKGEKVSDDMISIHDEGTIVIKTKLEVGCENGIIIDGLPERYKGGIEISNSQVIIGGIGNNEGYHNGSLGLNLGTVEETQDVELRLKFSKAIDFSLSQIKVFSYDMSNMAQYCEDRRVIDYDEVQVGVNTITAQIDLASNKLICAAVPFSKGWSAKVDGKKVKVYCVNEMYLGIEVPSGIHEIEFQYHTPWIYVGVFLWVVGILISICYFVNKKTERKAGGIRA